MAFLNIWQNRFNVLLSKYKVKNSSSFVNEAKNRLVRKDEIQVPYDIIILYPSIPINKVEKLL